MTDNTDEPQAPAETEAPAAETAVATDETPVVETVVAVPAAPAPTGPATRSRAAKPAKGL